MKFYHGSRNDNLKVLTLDYSKDKIIYLTNDKILAIFYAGNGFRSWKWDKEKNKLVIIERCRNMLKKLYYNKTCYLYTTEDIKDYQEVELRNTKTCYVVKTQDVKLDAKETIENVYQVFIDLYKKGLIDIWFWKDAPLQIKRKYKLEMKKLFNEAVMKDFRKNNFDDYLSTVKCFPYLKVKI